MSFLISVTCISSQSWALKDCFKNHSGQVLDRTVARDMDDCYGSFTWISGNKQLGKYLGEWKKGNKHGQGTQTYADGDKYVGEWKDNKMDGQGTYTYANGDKYKGE